MKRHNQILAGILVIQVILSAIVFWPKPATTAAGDPLFPDLVADDIVALTITDADDNSIELRRVTGNWVLPDADDYPAREGTISSFLEKVADLTTARLVTRTDASHRRLQVTADGFERRIEVETMGGDRHTIYLGSSPRYGSTHFRADGLSETYLTSELSVWDSNADAGSWIDTIYLDMPQDTITKATVENSSGTLIFTKDAEGVWTMEGLAADETLNETAVTGLVQSAASVSMIRPLGKEGLPAYGMEEPNAVVTLDTADETIILRVGAKDPDDNSYVVASSESPYYVRVSEFTVRDLVEKGRDDFIQVPPTPTPGETGALGSGVGSGVERAARHGWRAPFA
jgi:YD repeat-containing protein